jgi:DUF177 domain-containing protein
MLVLDVARMRDGVSDIDRTIHPPALPVEEEYRVLTPVVLAATVSKDKTTIRVAGRAVARLELACSRCLEAFEVPVDARFDLVYLPTPDTAAGEEEEAELADEDINTAFYRDGQVDLAEMLHEQLYLALPMKPLCRDDCKGLCPVCGANMNLTTCACAPRWEDPRLAGLKALLRDDDA